MTVIERVSLADVTHGQAVKAGRYERRPGVLLVLVSPDGARGIGEASPLLGYSRDDLESTRSALGRLAPRRLNLALERVRSGSILERLSALSGLLDETLPAARFALETAYLDLECRLTASAPSALLPMKPTGALSVAALLPELGSGSLDVARALVREGYSTLKVKLVRAGRAELEILGQLVKLGVKLRLDANRGLERADWMRIGPELAALGIEFVEEPCHDCRARDLGSRSLALALDESLQDLRPSKLAQLLDRSGARVVVLKPMVLGGLTRCLALAERAEERGVSVVVSHAFDGPVALHATCLLALSVQSPKLAAGLAPHVGLEQWPRAPSPFRRPGVLEAAAFDRPWLAPEQALGEQSAGARP